MKLLTTFRNIDGFSLGCYKTFTETSNIETSQQAGTPISSDTSTTAEFSTLLNIMMHFRVKTVEEVNATRTQDLIHEQKLREVSEDVSKCQQHEHPTSIRATKLQELRPI